MSPDNPADDEPYPTNVKSSTVKPINDEANELPASVRLLNPVPIRTEANSMLPFIL